MFVIGLLNSKGGVGKTTLAACLATRAAQDSNRVCLVDLDPQESTADWHRLRGSPENPTLFVGEDRASDAIEKAELAGFDWCFLDGPPGSLLVTQDAIGASTLVVVPMRASGIDLLATEDAVKLCMDARIPYLVVFNQTKAGARDRLLDAARMPLLNAGIPIGESTISQRVAFVSAMSAGKTGPEQDKAAAKEIDALWREIKAATLKAAQPDGRAAE